MKEDIQGNDYYKPIHPGLSLIELMKTWNITHDELIKRTKLRPHIVKLLYRGKTVLTPEIAKALEGIKLCTESFWNSMEKIYREKIFNSPADCSYLGVVKSYEHEFFKYCIKSKFRFVKFRLINGGKSDYPKEYTFKTFGGDYEVNVIFSSEFAVDFRESPDSIRFYNKDGKRIIFKYINSKVMEYFYNLAVQIEDTQYKFTTMLVKFLGGKKETVTKWKLKTIDGIGYIIYDLIDKNDKKYRIKSRIKLDKNYKSIDDDDCVIKCSVISFTKKRNQKVPDKNVTLIEYNIKNLGLYPKVLKTVKRRIKARALFRLKRIN